MRKIRVLLFTNILGGGGAEKQLLRLANHLPLDAFEPIVAVCRGGGSYESRLRHQVPLHPLAPRWIQSSTASLIASGWPLRRLIAREKPDVVCAFMDSANVLTALVAPRRGGPRLVLCVQNTTSEELASGRHVVSRIVYRLAHRTYPRADRVVVLSQGAAADLVSHVPAAEPLVTVIYNAGVDDELIEAAAEPLKESPPHPLIVACGRLAPQKGFRYLLDAFAEVQAATGAHLWILGDGPDRELLEEQAMRKGIHEKVSFLGFQSNPFKFLAAADLFVLSSNYEGFGNVVVEAMASGAPVVSTDCPHGPGEIIEDGVSGLLVPPGDATALACAMRRVLDDPELADRLRAAGRRRAADFHVSRSAAAYAELFRRLAEGR